LTFPGPLGPLGKNSVVAPASLSDTATGALDAPLGSGGAAGEEEDAFCSVLGRRWTSPRPTLCPGTTTMSWSSTTGGAEPFLTVMGRPAATKAANKALDSTNTTAAVGIILQRCLARFGRFPGCHMVGQRVTSLEDAPPSPES